MYGSPYYELLLCQVVSDNDVPQVKGEKVSSEDLPRVPYDIVNNDNKGLPVKDLAGKTGMEMNEIVWIRVRRYDRN